VINSSPSTTKLGPSMFFASQGQLIAHSRYFAVVACFNNLGDRM
jgi:hypothetical protein